MAKRKADSDRELLRALIEEATVDCYGPDEELTGLWTMIEDQVVCPCRAKAVGEEVEVTGFEWPNGGEVFYAVCERKAKKHRVDLSSLEWIKPYPEGFEWIEAYLAWREWAHYPRASRAPRGMGASWAWKARGQEMPCGKLLALSWL